MKTAIIGGGPAGLMAALASSGDVYLYEKNSDVGKKLLLTGNGRCNYFNSDMSLSNFYSSSDASKFINGINLNKL